MCLYLLVSGLFLLLQQQFERENQQEERVCVEELTAWFQHVNGEWFMAEPVTPEPFSQQ